MLAFVGTSENSGIQNRPRKGSVRLGNLELNPFLRSPNRPRSTSLRATLFGNRKSTIEEGTSKHPKSPTRPGTGSSTGRERSTSDPVEEEEGSYRMLGE